MTQLNLQDTMLNQVRREQIEVTLVMTGGAELRGMVKGFDNFTIILTSGDQQIMVYKHAVAFVKPSRQIMLGPQGRHMA